MLNELIKETIVLTQCACKESSQLLLEGDIIVSDQKPDMSVILKTDASISIDRTEISTDRLNVGGKLNLRVLYLAKGTETPVHSMIASMPVEDFISMEGIDRDMWVDVSANISNIDYKMLNDRKISYRAVIDITAQAESRVAHDVVTSIEDFPESHLKKSRLNVNRTVECREDRFVVKNEVTLPSGKSNVRNILQSNVVISNKDAKVGNGRVNVSGELTATTLYAGDDDAVLEFVEHELPFNGFIDTAGAREGMFGDITLRVSEQSVTIGKDDDGEDRVLVIEAVISAVVKVTSQNEIVVLDDAYCINKDMVFQKESVSLPRMICRNKNQCPVKEIVQLDQICPDMLQIFHVTGVPVLDSVKVYDDRITVEGIIETNILYIAKNDKTPLYNHKAVIPYKQTIETKGASPQMDVSVEHSVEHTGFNMLSDREVELRFLICFNVKVVDNVQTSVITNLSLVDMDKSIIDKMASVTVYVVQKGDSLWSIAKKYNTSIDDLAAVNDILPEDTEKLHPGRKLLVLKKMPA